MARKTLGFRSESLTRFPCKASWAQGSSGVRVKEYVALEGAGNWRRPGQVGGGEEEGVVSVK